MYTYKCWSIFFCSRYLRNNRLRTRILFIQITFSGIRALAVPWRLPYPLCLPFLLASRFSRVRALLCTTCGFLMIRPSLISFLMFCREFAFAISEDSFGSSQIFFLPHFNTLAAKRFWSLRVLKVIRAIPFD